VDNLKEFVVVVMVVQALNDPVKGNCEETHVHMGGSLNTFLILHRHLEAVDQLHTTTSLNGKPSYYFNSPSIPNNLL
jgi:hypothetical protein